MDSGSAPLLGPLGRSGSSGSIHQGNNTASTIVDMSSRQFSSSSPANASAEGSSNQYQYHHSSSPTPRSPSIPTHHSTGPLLPISTGTGGSIALPLGSNLSSSSPTFSSATSPGSPPMPGMIENSVAVLEAIRAALPLRVRPWFWIGLWFAFTSVLIGLFAGFHTKIFEMLEALATFIKGLGSAGPPVIMLCMILASFPPIVGYSSLITMSGYVFGFQKGFLVAYTSALMGSILCFYLCRRWFKVQVRKLMARNQSMKSALKAVEKQGFKLLCLIRLAPYPFNVMNALLSATHIPLSKFALATAISLWKLTLHVYIGSTLQSLTADEPEDGGDGGDGGPEGDKGGNHGKTLKVVFMVFSIILGFVIGAYVWTITKREIAASEGLRVERRRRRRASLRLSQRQQQQSGGVRRQGNGLRSALGLGSADGNTTSATATGETEHDSFLLNQDRDYSSDEDHDDEDDGELPYNDDDDDDFEDDLHQSHGDEDDFLNDNMGLDLADIERGQGSDSFAIGGAAGSRHNPLLSSPSNQAGKQKSTTTTSGEGWFAQNGIDVDNDRW